MSEHYPVLNDPHLKSFPWSLIRDHEKQADKNHGQTLNRLAQRGGLSCAEALAIIEDRPFERMDINRARVLLTHHIYKQAVAAAVAAKEPQQ